MVKVTVAPDPVWGVSEDIDVARSNSVGDVASKSSPCFIVIGKTGAGKSTFIKTLGGRDDKGNPPVVDDGLGSCTFKPTLYGTKIGEQEILLLDTPGFDDSARDNLEILYEISTHVYTFQQNSTIAIQGIIFLHDISEVRLGGSQKKTWEIFRAICGDEGMKSVIVGTTMWSEHPFTGGSNRKFENEEKREHNLLEHWGGIYGTRRLPFQDREAAVKIVTELLAKPPAELLLQKELAQPPHTVENTSAGRLALPEGQAESERLRKEMEELQKEQETLERQRLEEQRKIEEEHKKREEEARRQFEEQRRKLEEENRRRQEEQIRYEEDIRKQDEEDRAMQEEDREKRKEQYRLLEEEYKKRLEIEWEEKRKQLEQDFRRQEEEGRRQMEEGRKQMEEELRQMEEKRRQLQELRQSKANVEREIHRYSNPLVPVGEIGRRCRRILGGICRFVEGVVDAVEGVVHFVEGRVNSVPGAPPNSMRGAPPNSMRGAPPNSTWGDLADPMWGAPPPSTWDAPGSHRR